MSVVDGRTSGRARCCCAGLVIGAGAIRDLVFERLHGRAAQPPRDIDYAFFDPINLSVEREEVIESELRQRCPELPFEARNQARVHLWYEQHFGNRIEPYRSIEQAVSTWPRDRHRRRRPAAPRRQHPRGRAARSRRPLRRSPPPQSSAGDARDLSRAARPTAQPGDAVATGPRHRRLASLALGARLQRGNLRSPSKRRDSTGQHPHAGSGEIEILACGDAAIRRGSLTPMREPDRASKHDAPVDAHPSTQATRAAGPQPGPGRPSSRTRSQRVGRSPLITDNAGRHGGADGIARVQE